MSALATTGRFLRMVKIEHSVFALPFAMTGMIYAAGGWPGWRVFSLIVLAMVGARSAAMAFNRIADSDIDKRNPRTAARELPSGMLKKRDAFVFFLCATAAFLCASAALNRVTLLLAPVALFVLLFYSFTKRFTVFCHYFVGLSLGIAPAAAYIAVCGEFTWIPIFWLLAVTLWTGGFDILYALQDEEFDRGSGLRSIPAWLGRRKAIFVSRISHVAAVICLALAGWRVDAGPFYYVGCGFAAMLLAYEQSLLKEDDISRLNMAFFTLNGYVSIGFFAFSLIDVVRAGK